MFNARIPGQSQTIMFRPTPDDGRCVRRRINLEPAEGELIVSRQNVTFSPLAVDGPPDVEVPHGKTLQYRFVCDIHDDMDDELVVVGVQFLVDGDVKHSQKYRRPMKLSGMDQVDEIRVVSWQVIGIPANDGKQTNILFGSISVAGLCACPSCMCLRENFGKWPKLLLERCETKYGATAVATKTSLEPELRSGTYCVEKLAEVFERKNLDGAVKMTAKHWRRLMVECGNVVATPLLRILPQKTHSTLSIFQQV